MKDRAAQLYQEVILQHSKHPYHFRKQESADQIIEAYNQFCGDHFHLYVNIDEGIITDPSFHGYGCAISKASASVLTQTIEGKTLEELGPILAEFQEIIHPSGEEETTSKHEAFLAFAAARKFPGRDKCALLTWNALKEWTIGTDS